MQNFYPTIFRTNQLIGFCMRGTLAANGLTLNIHLFGIMDSGFSWFSEGIKWKNWPKIRLERSFRYWKYAENYI